MNRQRSLCAALCLVFCLSLTACSQENMSKVTINFGEIPLAKAAEKAGFLDRLAGLFLPRAYAEWTPGYAYILLTVTGADMDAVTALVPPGSYKYTIEIPTGDMRLFTLFAYEGGVKKWGGHVAADANESEVDVNMRLYPVVTNISVASMLPVAVGFRVRWDRISTATGYYIYRAVNLSGPYQMLDYKAEDHLAGQQSYEDAGVSGTYHYRIAVHYPYGEGEPCDAK